MTDPVVSALMGDVDGWQSTMLLLIVGLVSISLGVALLARVRALEDSRKQRYRQAIDDLYGQVLDVLDVVELPTILKT